ncbi:MAG TPA: holo-ACP synthase [Chlamydiales bacterium]
MTSNIKGLGNDIVEVTRIRESIERHGKHFLDRLFTQKEQDYCNKFQDSALHFAGRFAAKEALAKALGTGFGAELSWLDLEILNNAQGKPIVHLSQELKKRVNPSQILVSISHTVQYATAVAILA